MIPFFMRLKVNEINLNLPLILILLILLPLIVLILFIVLLGTCIWMGIGRGFMFTGEIVNMIFVLKDLEIEVRDKENDIHISFY